MPGRSAAQHEPERLLDEGAGAADGFDLVLVLARPQVEDHPPAGVGS
jgi:hypothetical protein